MTETHEVALWGEHRELFDADAAAEDLRYALEIISGWVASAEAIASPALEGVMQLALEALERARDVAEARVAAAETAVRS